MAENESLIKKYIEHIEIKTWGNIVIQSIDIHRFKSIILQHLSMSYIIKYRLYEENYNSILKSMEIPEYKLNEYQKWLEYNSK